LEIVQIDQTDNRLPDKVSGGNVTSGFIILLHTANMVWWCKFYRA